MQSTDITACNSRGYMEDYREQVRNEEEWMKWPEMQGGGQSL